MERLKSKTLWVAVAAFLPILSESLSTYGIDLVLPGNWDIFVSALLGIFVLAGILKNPSNNKAERKKEEQHELQKYS